MDCLIRLLCFMMILVFSGIAVAEVYKWVDSNGRLHYSDVPPENVNAKKLDIKINSIEAVSVERNALPTEPLSGKAGKKTVVMYSTEWCGYCKIAAKYFRKQGIPFKEYDVEKSSKGKRDYKRLKGNGVPIILIGKSRMNGFSQARFDQLYY